MIAHGINYPICIFFINHEFTEKPWVMKRFMVFRDVKRGGNIKGVLDFNGCFFYKPRKKMNNFV